MLYTERDAQLHDHCAHCFRPNCTSGCALIACPNRCQNFKFHACKAEEHLLNICPLEQVACLNASFGCPSFVRRRDIAKHLSVCPASIVVCTVEWNRSLLRVPNAKVQLKALTRDEGSDAKELDVRAALRDQELVRLAYEIPRYVRKRHEDFFNKHFPLLPIERENADGMLDVNENVVCKLESSDDDDVSDMDKTKLQQCAVARECMLCQTDPTSQHLHVLGNNPSSSFASDRTAAAAAAASKHRRTPHELSLFSARHRLLVRLDAQFWPKCFVKQRRIYSFQCGHVVRRMDVARHNELHATIQCGMDGVMVERCPMYLDGCDVARRKLVPMSGGGEEWRVGFNSFLDSFVILPRTTIKEAREALVERVPVDVLQRVCGFLDSASLCCLAATCKLLRDVCATLLTTMGVTDRPWIKTIVDDDGVRRVRWVEGNQRWYFTRMFQPPASWRWTPSNLGDHVQRCPCYRPVRYKAEPVRVMLSANGDEQPLDLTGAHDEGAD